MRAWRTTKHENAPGDRRRCSCGRRSPDRRRLQVAAALAAFAREAGLETGPHRSFITGEDRVLRQLLEIGRVPEVAPQLARGQCAGQEAQATGCSSCQYFHERHQDTKSHKNSC